MNSGHSWRGIDPTQFSDGVLYLPDMVEIQPRKPDWGLHNMAHVLARITKNRPHGRDEADGKLLCLRCMTNHVRSGKELVPIWMHFKQRNGLRLFCHAEGGHVHAEHMPESDKHKALAEREMRTCERVGATVEAEVCTARGRRRADFIAVGSTVTLAGEIQLTRISRQSVGQRQRDLARAGNRALWTTDSIRPEFLDGVPRLVIPALTGWQQALRAPELRIVAGWWQMEYQRCGWADVWTGTQRCPRSGSPVPCGRLHAYPTRERLTRVGGSPDLDFVVGGIVMGEWLPYQRKVRNGRPFEWIPTEDYARVIEDRGGGSPELAERNASTSRYAIVAAARTCETGDRSFDTAMIPGSTAASQMPPAAARDLAGVPPDAGDVFKRDGWADHPRWAGAPRCTICRQPMFVDESISTGMCARHRYNRAHS